VAEGLDRWPTLTSADLHARIRETAFALLLTGRRPASAEEIAGLAGVSRAAIGPLLDELAVVGWIDRDAIGQVTGSGGLSLTDGPHRLTIDGAEFRNWCAYDSLGIAAALGADAAIDTVCAVCGTSIQVRTVDGQPPADSPVRLWLAEGGADLRADFCAPTVLLCSAEHAAAWAEQHDRRGRVVDIAEGSRLGREAWASCARAVAAVSGQLL